MVSMIALEQQKKKLVLNLLSQRQNFPSVYIIMVIRVTYIKIKQRFENLGQMITQVGIIFV